MEFYNDDDIFVSLIYSAAVSFELWPEVLTKLAIAVDAIGAVLLACGAYLPTKKWTGGQCSASVYQAKEALIRLEITKWAISKPSVQVQQDADLGDIFDPVSSEEWQVDPLCTERMKPFDFGPVVSAFFNGPSNDVVALHVIGYPGRPTFSAEAIDRLNFFLPCFKRAILLARHWRLKQYQFATQFLSTINYPALIINQDRRVIASNTFIDEMKGHVRVSQHDNLHFIDPVADKSLGVNLDEFLRQPPRIKPSFLVRSRANDEPLVCSLAPIAKLTRSMFDGILGVLILLPISTPQSLDINLIRDLFDLTRREAQVATAISEGLTINEIASSLGVGRETVRSQVKAVLAKTGTRNQTEITSLLRGLPKLSFQSG